MVILENNGGYVHFGVYMNELKNGFGYFPLFSRTKKTSRIVNFKKWKAGGGVKGVASKKRSKEKAPIRSDSEKHCARFRKKTEEYREPSLVLPHTL